MIVADAPEAFGYTIFCDDIRMEIGGKLTYVGVYQSGTMLVPGSFPATVPKLALGIVYKQRHDKVVLPFTLWIFFPGDAEDKPSIIAEMPEQAARTAIQEAKATAEKLTTEGVFATLNSQFAIMPLHIAQPGLLRVRAVRGKQLIGLGSLNIIPASPDPHAPPQP
jgi:hypothetical protein